MTAFLSPTPRQKFFTLQNQPAAFHLLYTYAANTTNPVATFSDRAGTVPNANPIVLDAQGEAVMYLQPDQTYDFVLRTPFGETLRTYENIEADSLAIDLGSADAGKGAALVNFKLSGVAAAVGRAVEAKLAETVSVKDFGAKGDGTTDDTAAIQAAIAFAQGSCGALYIPNGKYRTSGIVINGTSGLDFIGQRQPHVNNEVGVSFLYTGTGNAITVADGTGAFMYRVYLRNFAIYFTQNANAGVYAKNLQECLIENVGVWAQGKTVQHGFDLDGIGIVHIDNNVASRTVNGLKMHFGTLPNPQAAGGCNITRNNFFYCTNAVVTGYTLGLNISDNWFEGFTTGVLCVNDNPRIEVVGLDIERNTFIQSTTGLSETRALRVLSQNNANPIRFSGNFRNNFCFMDSSGATKPTYAVSFDMASNTSVVEVDAAVENNWFIGVTGAGIYADSHKAKVRESGNRTITTLFGTPLPNIVGGGSKLTESRVLYQSAVAVGAPASTAESALVTVQVPAYLMGRNGRLRITALWASTNNANTKLIRVRLNDLAGTVIGQIDNGGSDYATVTTTLANRNSLTSQYGDSFAIRTAGATPNWRTTPAANTANDLPLLFTVQKSVAGDSVVLESLLVEVLPL